MRRRGKWGAKIAYGENIQNEGIPNFPDTLPSATTMEPAWSPDILRQLVSSAAPRVLPPSASSGGGKIHNIYPGNIGRGRVFTMGIFRDGWRAGGWWVGVGGAYCPGMSLAKLTVWSSASTIPHIHLWPVRLALRFIGAPTCVQPTHYVSRWGGVLKGSSFSC